MIKARCTENEYQLIKRVAKMLEPIHGNENLSSTIRFLINLGFLVLDSIMDKDKVNMLIEAINRSVAQKNI